MIDKNIIAFLKAQATSASTKIYTGTAPQQTDFPVVVVRRNGGNTPRTQSGAKLFTRTQYSIISVGRNYADSLTLAAEVRTALDNFHGLLTSDPAGTETDVRSCRCASEPTDISEADGDLVLRGVSQEFLFVYLE